MAPSTALNDIRGPSLVMKAVAAFRTLHTTITCEKVTAHTKGEAMRFVGTQKLAGSDLR